MCSIQETTYSVCFMPPIHHTTLKRKQINHGNHSRPVAQLPKSFCSRLARVRVVSKFLKFFQFEFCQDFGLQVFEIFLDHKSITVSVCVWEGGSIVVLGSEHTILLCECLEHTRPHTHTHSPTYTLSVTHARNTTIKINAITNTNFLE